MVKFSEITEHTIVMYSTIFERENSFIHLLQLSWRDASAIFGTKAKVSRTDYNWKLSKSIWVLNSAQNEFWQGEIRITHYRPMAKVPRHWVNCTDNFSNPASTLCKPGESYLWKFSICRLIITSCHVNGFWFQFQYSSGFRIREYPEIWALVP